MVLWWDKEEEEEVIGDFDWRGAKNRSMKEESGEYCMQQNRRDGKRKDDGDERVYLGVYIVKVR